MAADIKIQVSIPMSFLKRLSKYEKENKLALRTPQIQKVFSQYLKELLNHPYDQTADDFEVWLTDGSADDFLTNTYS